MDIAVDVENLWFLREIPDEASFWQRSLSGRGGGGAFCRLYGFDVLWFVEEPEKAGRRLFGFAASFLLRPVFIVRYMVPAAGCFWFSFAFCASSAAKSRKIFLPVLAAIFLLGIGDYRWFRNDETWRRVRMEEVEEAMGQIAPEDVVITQFNQVQGVTGYYLENDIYLWNAEPEPLICDIFENKYFSFSSADDIKTWMEEGKNIWLIGNKNNDLLEEWEKEGIFAEEKQEVMLEVYWFTLYRLHSEALEDKS